MEDCLRPQVLWSQTFMLPNIYKNEYILIFWLLLLLLLLLLLVLSTVQIILHLVWYKPRSKIVTN